MTPQEIKDKLLQLFDTLVIEDLIREHYMSLLDIGDEEPREKP